MSVIILFINDNPSPDEFFVEKYGLIRSSISPSYPGPLSKKVKINFLSIFFKDISIVGLFVDTKASIEFLKRLLKIISKYEWSKLTNRLSSILWFISILS